MLDVGCGLADLLDALAGRGFAGPYTGVDLLPAFVSEAADRFADCWARSDLAARRGATAPALRRPRQCFD